MCQSPGFLFSFSSVVSRVLIYVRNYPVSIFSTDSQDWAVCVYINNMTIDNNTKSLLYRTNVESHVLKKPERNKRKHGCLRNELRNSCWMTVNIVLLRFVCFYLFSIPLHLCLRFFILFFLFHTVAAHQPLIWRYSTFFYCYYFVCRIQLWNCGRW